MKILHLTLKKKWFDMIASGEKREEYREIKQYWVSRLTVCNAPKEFKDDNRGYADNFCFDVDNGHSPDDILKASYAKFKEFDLIEFRNGYGKDAPCIYFECKGISFGWGIKEWGAEPETEYFCIQIGPQVYEESLPY